MKFPLNEFVLAGILFLVSAWAATERELPLAALFALGSMFFSLQAGRRMIK